MEEEVNRLAKGLVREELKSLPLTDQRFLARDLSNFFRKYKLIYSQKQGATPKQLNRIVSQTEEYLNSTLCRFQPGRITVRNKMNESVNFNASLIWTTLPTVFERPDGEDLADIMDEYGYDNFTGFTEDILQLGYQRLGISSTGILLSHIYQRLVVSTHVLYRLVDRGAVNQQPLAYLSNNIADVLRYTNALMMVGTKNGFIPFADGGLVLHTFLVEEPENQPDWKSYDRFNTGTFGGKVFCNYPEENPSPTNFKHPTIEGGLAWIDYRITTYLTDNQMCSSKLWVKLEFQKLKEQFPLEFEKLISLNTSWDIDSGARELLDNVNSDFYIAMKRFTKNPRFLDACRSNQ